MARNLLWDIFEIYWSSVLTKLGNAEVTSPALVTIHLMDIMGNNELISYIMFLNSVPWHVPHKLNVMAVHDGKQYV